MNENLILSLSAMASLVPLSLLILRQDNRRDSVYWSLLAVATLGPITWVVVNYSGTWQTGLAASLWITVAASMFLFANIAVLTHNGWRLYPLFAPYMFFLGFIATIWLQAPQRSSLTGGSGWVELHIIVSVLTYAFATLAAIAALGAFLQERSLKRKQPTALTHQLPSVADCEALLVRLLLMAEIVLGLGLASGMATLYGETGKVLAFDHKTILTIASFAVIGALLIAHYKTGIRGRRAARAVLVGYLLLTLGYPGVKFVTDVLLP